MCNLVEKAHFLLAKKWIGSSEKQGSYKKTDGTSKQGNRLQRCRNQIYHPLSQMNIFKLQLWQKKKRQHGVLIIFSRSVFCFYLKFAPKSGKNYTTSGCFQQQHGLRSTTCSILPLENFTRWTDLLGCENPPRALQSCPLILVLCPQVACSHSRSQKPFKDIYKTPSLYDTWGNWGSAQHTIAAGLTGTATVSQSGTQSADSVHTSGESSQSCFESPHCTKKKRAAPTKILVLPQRSTRGLEIRGLTLLCCCISRLHVC